MRDNAAVGMDMLSAQLWKNSPHWFKARLYDLLIARFLDLHWESETLEAWTTFELLGVPKNSAPNAKERPTKP